MTPRTVLAAALLAIGLAFSPLTSSPAAAATGRLLVSADATYTVAPADRAVHVSVAIRLVNDKPSTAVYYYFWREVSWTVQREATKVAARDGSGAIKVSTVGKETFQDLTLTLRRDLLYKQAVAVTLTYDLPDGGARSGSDVHVGSAFVAFEAWTWGDEGKGSLLIRVPDNFDVTTDGSSTVRSTEPGLTILKATAIASPFDFYVDLSGLDETRLSSDPVSLPGGVDLVVRGWPEDAEWRSKVTGTLKTGLPKLMDLIGLPWKPTKPLDVSEAFGPDLEGYAGLFLESDSSIRISDNVDEVTILHEASHIWFNSDLFTDRWIDEGFAQEYSVEAATAIGVPATAPTTPVASEPGHAPLVGWQKPGRVTTENEAAETWGYNASWWVIRQLVTELGPARMRDVVAAADADTLAYAGDGPPEPASTAAGWQRFLDLLDNVGDATDADDLFATWVVDHAGADLLDQRSRARDAYAALAAAGKGWAVPVYVRRDMGDWQFPLATIAMREATATLGLRDEVETAAGALGLEPGKVLETAYEGADEAMTDVDTLARAELDALALLDTAHDAVTAEPDLITSIGLIGSTPASTYTEAGAAFEADDLETATTDANAAIAAVEDAPGIGRQRVAIGGGGTAVVLLGAGGLLLLRRRRRTRATLAADPHDAIDPQVERPAEVDGGPPGSGGPALDD